jgi:hypothetical protein
MSTTNWQALVAKLSKAEKDASEWRAGLADAETTLASAKAEMATALGMKPGQGSNGSAHKASPAPVPTTVKLVKRGNKHDFARKARIAALAKEKGGFLTINDVAGAEKVSASLATGVLARMAALGKLRRVGIGRYALPETKAA